MELLFEVGSLLEAHRYAITRPLRPLDELQFEDESLLGFVWAAPSVSALLAEWKTRQDAFLRRSASRLRTGETKSWNLYVVLLTHDRPNESDRSSLIEIEEDFRSARKIAQAELTTTSQVRRALYPFLPIQNVVAIERSDALQRFRSRLSGVPVDAVNALFSGESVELNIRRFSEAHENKGN